MGEREGEKEGDGETSIAHKKRKSKNTSHVDGGKKICIRVTREVGRTGGRKTVKRG